MTIAAPEQPHGSLRFDASRHAAGTQSEAMAPTMLFTAGFHIPPETSRAAVLNELPIRAAAGKQSCSSFVVEDGPGAPRKYGPHS